MELIIVVRTNNFSLQLRRTVENPTVQSQHVLGGNTVLLGLEPVQVRQHKARGVTNPSVRIGSALKDLIGNAHLADRKSTRLNSSHVAISYAVFCLKKKREKLTDETEATTHV